MYQDGNLLIRPIEYTDLFCIWELEYKDEKPEWKRWDAPYYPHQSQTYEEFLPIGESWIKKPTPWVIEVDGIVRGMVSYY